MRFGEARLYRSDIGILQKAYYKVFGVADPGHYLRSKYFRLMTQGLNPKSILDAGCGAGDYVAFMATRWPQATVHGVDVDRIQIEKNESILARMKLTNVKFSCEDVTMLSTCEAYDLITCIDALEHIENQSRVLSNFHRALSTNGALYLHIPLARPRPVPFSRHLHSMHEWSKHEHIAPMRTREEMFEMVVRAGFRIEKWRDTFAYHAGELACSLFALFHKNTKLNLIAQGLVSPLTRILAGVELVSRQDRGFALAVLAGKA